MVNAPRIFRSAFVISWNNHLIFVNRSNRRNCIPYMRRSSKPMHWIFEQRMIESWAQNDEDIRIEWECENIWRFWRFLHITVVDTGQGKTGSFIGLEFNDCKWSLLGPLMPRKWHGYCIWCCTFNLRQTHVGQMHSVCGYSISFTNIRKN